MNKITKTLLVGSFAVMALCLLIFCLGVAGNSSANFHASLEMNGDHFIPLNKNAQSAEVSSSSKPYMFYKFTARQKNFIAEYMRQNGGAALQVLIEAASAKKKSDDGRFEFGFLYEDDFLSETELCPELKARNSIKGKFESLVENKVRLLFCMEKDGALPSGFYLYGDQTFSLGEVKLSEAKIGWSKFSEGQEKVPLFAFGSDGGFVDSSFLAVDFSSAGKVFANANSLGTLLPKVELQFAPIEDVGSPDNPVTFHLRAGNEVLKVIRAKKLPLMVIQTSSLQEPFSSYEFIRGADMLISVFMSANDESLLPQNGLALKGLPTDLGLVCDWPMENWRQGEYELYEWAEFPGIIFFDFANSKIQDQFFTRLAYFVEKEGYKGSFVDDEFILNNHGYNAHDYGAASLAKFFTQAERQRVRLNDCERLLKKVLLANSIILQRDDGSFAEGSGAVVSMSRSSTPELRKKFLAHECWHGIYFTNAPFRNLIAGLHKKFNPQAREFLEVYWANNPNLHYDRSDDFLMKNEFMAYMLQQNPAEAKKYFMGWARDSFMPRIAPKLSDYVIQNSAEDFVSMSSLLDSWTFENWGLGAGRVSLILR
ncbi:MAG: hypothetical protein J6P28_01995 [Treponema sp.]|nr:hypothetical protein [Treponema sp.]